MTAPSQGSLAAADPVARAIARADAKDRIRTATNIRQSGLGVTTAGIGLLTVRHSWLPSIHAFGNGFWHGVVTMSATILVGIICVGLGPIIFAAGNILLRRARDSAARDPVTAVVIDQPL